MREDGIYWRCNLCKDKVKRYVATGTTHPAGHLRGFHGLRNEDQGKSVRAKAIGGLAPIFMPVRPFVCEEYKQRLVEWILLDRIPFRQVETNTFRNMMETANPAAVNATLKSGDTIRAWAMHEFELGRSIVKSQLQDAISQIHISCDMWTSPNGHSMLGVVTHWSSSQKELQSALIGLPKVRGAHTGENIATALVDVLAEYDIAHRLGYMMMDNATNNNTAVQSITQEIARRGLGVEMRNVWWEKRRLRCSGHIYNLVLRALLFGKCKKLVQMSCLGFKFQGMYLPSEILPELRGASALFILKATDI
jgi:hypothetical protein